MLTCPMPVLLVKWLLTLAGSLVSNRVVTVISQLLSETNLLQKPRVTESLRAKLVIVPERALMRNTFLTSKRCKTAILIFVRILPTLLLPGVLELFHQNDWKCFLPWRPINFTTSIQFTIPSMLKTLLSNLLLARFLQRSCLNCPSEAGSKQQLQRFLGRMFWTIFGFLPKLLYVLRAESRKNLELYVVTPAARL